jgi:hypothetical protein
MIDDRIRGIVSCADRDNLSSVSYYALSPNYRRRTDGIVELVSVSLVRCDAPARAAEYKPLPPKRRHRR